MTGKIALVTSGPPVAESSSAASYSDCTQESTASGMDMSSEYIFFSADFAKIEPDPMEWNLCSSYGPPATS
jgi:hypothetical protein